VNTAKAGRTAVSEKPAETESLFRVKRKPKGPRRRRAACMHAGRSSLSAAGFGKPPAVRSRRSGSLPLKPLKRTFPRAFSYGSETSLSFLPAQKETSREWQRNI